MQEEISLKDLYVLIKKHFFKIFVLTLLGAILSLLFMNFLVSPKYRSESQILVNQRSGDQQTIQYNEIQSNIQLINTYRDIITGQKLLTEVSEAIGGAYSADELKSAVSVNQSTNSQVFTVKVVMEDPQVAQTVLAEITSKFDRTLREVYENDITNIYILQPASFDPDPVSPSKMRFVAIGAILGLAISGLYVLMVEMFDTTVKDEAFLQSLGITCLGEINSISSRDSKNARLPKINRGKE